MRVSCLPSLCDVMNLRFIQVRLCVALLGAAHTILSCRSFFSENKKSAMCMGFGRTMVLVYFARVQLKEIGNAAGKRQERRR